MFRSVLVVLALLCVLIFLTYLPTKSDPLPGIEAALFSGKQAELSFFPSPKAQYELYLGYAAEAVPPSVSERFFNPKSPPHTNWQALLKITTNHIISVSKDSLQLRPAIQRGRRLYFQIADCELNGGEWVNISLRSTEPAPFAEATPSLLIQPAGGFYNESRLLLGIFKRFAKIACICIMLALLLDRCVEIMRRKLKPRK